MRNLLSKLFWILVALSGGYAFVTLSTQSGHAINSIYILVAALCSYAIGYRFYSKWIAASILSLNDQRSTPCERNDDGKDFVKTNKWIVFGHHFAAISGPGPLVGPVLAAQFGYLPGTLWILIGVVLGGAVQDFIILFSSLRRDGKSLGQMVKEEMNSFAGGIAMVAILSIMVILLAVLALVVVRTLAESPWGVFTVGATIPIAMFMGGYLRFVRIGKVLEASVFGVALLLLAVWGGRLVHENPAASKLLTFNKETLAWGLIAYGMAASILPIWLLLAPRDYLSTFMKLGTIFALACGIFLTLPELRMPAVTKCIDGSGLVFAGKLFPFCFITIACGAMSGFHSLIASGTTPKILTRESYSRPVGYGAMCLESLVAIMAIIAACTLEPGVYFSMNVDGPAGSTIAKVHAQGFEVTNDQMEKLAIESGEKTLYGRTGGAATLAVGMAQIFSKVTQGRWLDIWYHFAIMFEALFILTTLDAGTRVGRYLLQDMLGGLYKPLANTNSATANIFASALMVGAWGYFLVQGVRDPLGGINSLWPLFGIANQILAVIALCLGTTIVLKMQLKKRAEGGRGKPAYALVAMAPMIWLLCVTGTAGCQKIFHTETRSNFPRIGFVQTAAELDEKLPALQSALTGARDAGDSIQIDAATKALKKNRTLHFNNVLDACVTGFLLTLVGCISIIGFWTWGQLIWRGKEAELYESECILLPDYALQESRPPNLLGTVGLALALARELSGESELSRAHAAQQVCACEDMNIDLLGNKAACARKSDAELYVEMTERRFDGVKRCC